MLSPRDDANLMTRLSAMIWDFAKYDGWKNSCFSLKKYLQILSSFSAAAAPLCVTLMSAVCLCVSVSVSVSVCVSALCCAALCCIGFC